MNRGIEITLERGMCFGTCPVYSVTLTENGTVQWVGKQFVEVTGEATDHIDPAQVMNLSDTITAAGFFEMNNTYIGYDITDMPSVILTVRNNTTTKRIEHYHGDLSAPFNLTMIEDEVDIVAQSTRWIGNPTLNEGTWGEPI